MKVHIEMDMTPQEARAFMGLPDVAPLQKEMMEETRARMKAAFDTGDPEAMMQVWTPFLGGGSANAFEQFQKFLWDGARTISGKKDKT